MGGRVIRAVDNREDMEIALVVDRRGGSVKNFDVLPDDRLGSLLDSEKPDVVIDFTAPEATVRYVRKCSDAGVPIVTGTTGLDEEDLEELRKAGERTQVLLASNFSPGIQTLRKAVIEAVSSLSGYDIEITETHHSSKRDSPSGTAKTILDDIEDAIDVSDRVYGREGTQPRRNGEVGVHARRAGDVRGEHQVLWQATTRSSACITVPSQEGSSSPGR